MQNGTLVDYAREINVTKMKHSHNFSFLNKHFIHLWNTTQTDMHGPDAKHKKSKI